jgi:dephospho-CoA kinase
MSTPPLHTPHLIVAGPSCSGKGVAARYLSRVGYTILELGAPLVKLVPPDLSHDERLTYLSKLYQDTAGHALIDHALPALRGLSPDSPLAVIGVRQLPEVHEIKRLFPRIKTVGIYAPTDLRFSRAQARGRHDRPLSFHQFLHLTFWEYALGLATVLRDVDFMLENRTTEDALELLLQQTLLSPASSSS